MARNRVTRRDFDCWLTLDKRRKELGRQVRKIEKDQRAIEWRIKGEMGDDARYVMRSANLVACFVEGQRRPAWRSHFIERCGEDEARIIQESTAPSVRFAILPIASEEQIKATDGTKRCAT